jgi:hypothetical protein
MSSEAAAQAGVPGEAPGLLARILRRWTLLLGLSWTIGGALYLTLPPSLDQFSHGYFGWRVAQGDVPYRDFLDMNWPGIMGLHALSSALFGNHLWSWRCLDFLLLAVNAGFLFGLISRAAGREAAKLGVILLPLFYASLSSWVPGQHDMSAAQFLLGALWFHTRGYETDRKRWQIGTGVFLAAAMLNKPTVGILGLLLPLQALWCKAPLRSTVWHTATAGIVSVASLAGALGAVLACGASWGEVRDAVYTFNAETQFLGAVPLSRMTLQALLYLARWWPFLVLGCIPAAIWLLRRPNRSVASTTLPMLWLTGVLSYFIQRRGFGYHLSPSVLAMCGGVAVSISLLATDRWGLGSGVWRKRIAAAACLLVLAGSATKLATSFAPLGSAILARDMTRYWSRFYTDKDLRISDSVAFVKHLESLPPDDPVLVVGFDNSINYLARRRQPTRFYLFSMLYLSTPPLPMAERWVDLWEGDLKSARCRTALISRKVRTEWLGGDSRAARALREFLKSYHSAGFLGQDGAYEIYERD